MLHVVKQRDASYLLSHAEDVLPNEQQQEILDMTKQRLTGMPLAYILGEADFYGRTFIVTPDVLIPRPDTEVLIEKALDYIKINFQNKKEIYIADICTGSGIIAITIALELERTYNLPSTTYRLIATDISPTALAVAKQNAKKHGVADKIEFIQGDLLNPIKNRKIDLIVSNPPYVPSAELTSRLPSPYEGEGEDEVSANGPNQPSPPPSSPESRGLLFEPRIALDGGEDGLQFVRQIQEYAKKYNIPSFIETVGGEIISPDPKC